MAKLFVKYFYTKPDGSKFGSLLQPFEKDLAGLSKALTPDQMKAMHGGAMVTFKEKDDGTIVDVELWKEEDVVRSYGSLERAPINEMRVE